MASELECRICRGNSEDTRPLYHPCLCTGSIGLVHQDCLEAWLTHSRKERCELCSRKYSFEPYYDENAPTILPTTALLKSVFKIVFLQAFPLCLRALLAIVIWVFAVPIGSISVYSLFMRNNASRPWSSLFFSTNAICCGLVLDALIASSLLIVVRTSPSLLVSVH